VHVSVDILRRTRWIIDIGGNAYAHIPAQLMDIASTANALSSHVREQYTGSRKLLLEAKRSIVGVHRRLNI